ncbi:hypothetical protein O6H91_08G117700 [Diphasiastrum complanatum]|uniref:Uncharacterized protein n=1 Tax=Diphasiastrum complanatum TaxID=34168 RepID=A0ACC2D1R6_DIPCM|nr:hypothetical protein O6H91_08G117700 [Diphasiastrum complanatum]
MVDAHLMELVSFSDVLWRRWLRCIIWHSVISSIMWLLWELLCPSFGSNHRWRLILLPTLITFIGYILFLTAQLLFIVGETLVLQPESKDSASVGELVVGISTLAWRAALGGTSQGDLAFRIADLVQKMEALRDRVLFIILCIASGCLSLLSLGSPMYSYLGSLGMLDMSLRGAILGLFYGLWYIYQKRYVITFPIIQRRLFFSFKLGLAKAIHIALKTSLLMLPMAEILLRILHSDMVGGRIIRRIPRSFLFWHQVVHFLGAFLITFCWESCHHLIQVIQTKRHVFAPPLGSAAAETNPVGPLLSILEEADNLFLRYLAFLDLSIISEVSERNVESWRRAALFEETGETYRRIIGVSLQPLDNLAMKLVRGLEIVKSEKSGDILMQQMQSPNAQGKATYGGNLKELFRDFQLCAWSARTVAALTACSRTEDRYGVAQLTRSNGAVMSTLISCLLVVEVYLGRRSSLQPLSFAGPNGIKWAVPYRGALMEVDRKSLPFRKKSSLHKKGHAMADVLRTAIYRIVTVFRDEMLIQGSGSRGFSVAERDWLSKDKLLFGTYEMHLQKLHQLLEFKE